MIEAPGEEGLKMILITGGLGFFGCSLAYHLAGRGETVLLTRHRIARIPSFLESFIDKQVRITACDVLEFSSLSSVMENCPVNSIVQERWVSKKGGHYEKSSDSSSVGGDVLRGWYGRTGVPDQAY